MELNPRHNNLGHQLPFISYLIETHYMSPINNFDATNPISPHKLSIVLTSGNPKVFLVSWCSVPITQPPLITTYAETIPHKPNQRKKNSFRCSNSLPPSRNTSQIYVHIISQRYYIERNGLCPNVNLTLPPLYRKGLRANLMNPDP